MSRWIIPLKEIS
jgi:hypothetical protein